MKNKIKIEKDFSNRVWRTEISKSTKNGYSRVSEKLAVFRRKVKIPKTMGAEITN